MDSATTNTRSRPVSIAGDFPATKNAAVLAPSRVLPHSTGHNNNNNNNNNNDNKNNSNNNDNGGGDIGRNVTESFMDDFPLRVSFKTVEEKLVLFIRGTTTVEEMLMK